MVCRESTLSIHFLWWVEPQGSWIFPYCSARFFFLFFMSCVSVSDKRLQEFHIHVYDLEKLSREPGTNPMALSMEDKVDRVVKLRVLGALRKLWSACESNRRVRWPRYEDLFGENLRKMVCMCLRRCLFTFFLMMLVGFGECVCGALSASQGVSGCIVLPLHAPKWVPAH